MLRPNYPKVGVTTDHPGLRHAVKRSAHDSWEQPRTKRKDVPRVEVREIKGEVGSDEEMNEENSNNNDDDLDDDMSRAGDWTPNLKYGPSGDDEEDFGFGWLEVDAKAGGNGIDPVDQLLEWGSLFPREKTLKGDNAANDGSQPIDTAVSRAKAQIGTFKRGSLTGGVSFTDNDHMAIILSGFRWTRDIPDRIRGLNCANKCWLSTELLETSSKSPFTEADQDAAYQYILCYSNPSIPSLKLHRALKEELFGQALAQRNQDFNPHPQHSSRKKKNGNAESLVSIKEESDHNMQDAHAANSQHIKREPASDSGSDSDMTDVSMPSSSVTFHKLNISMLTSQQRARDGKAHTWMRLVAAVNTARSGLDGGELELFESLIARQNADSDHTRMIREWVREG